MGCEGCANLWKNNMCRSMRSKPKRNKWCYLTPEQAIDAELSVIAYINSQITADDEELRCMHMVETKAYSRIQDLRGGFGHAEA